MKVKPRHILHYGKNKANNALFALLLLTIGACDFDIPEKFEMPTWYLDLKIPLVQTRYQMTDISDSTKGIFPTNDSLGFFIVQEGSFPAQELPDFKPIPINLNETVSTGETPGINVDIELPGITIDQRIDVVLYGQPIYQDTAKYCSTITLPGGISFDTCFIDPTTGLVAGRPFSFPTDSVRTMTKDNYNSLIVALFDSVMGVLTSALDTTINLGLSSIPLPEDPPIISSVDTLLIGGDSSNSYYTTRFKNNGIPTDLINVHSFLVTGETEADLALFVPPTLSRDTLASHYVEGDLSGSSLSSGDILEKTTDLSIEGLKSYMKLATSMTLAEPSGDYITIPPGSLYVDFKLSFQMSSFDSMMVTTSDYSLSDGLEMPPLELPEMDMTEMGITRMEIYQNTLTNADSTFGLENRFILSNLKSTFPFPLRFKMHFKNFKDPLNQDSVYFDRILHIDSATYERSIPMYNDDQGWSIQSTAGDNDGDGVPDSAFSSFDLDLDIGTIAGPSTIPLDGSSLGGFTMNMQLQALRFSSIKANIYMEMPAPPTEQEFPPGFTGAIPTEAQISIIFKNQIQLPIKMKMDFKGYNSLGELTYVPIIIDTIGIPDTDSASDSAETRITLSKLGTTISIKNSYLDSTVSYTNTSPPCDTCSTIIDLLASNPVSMLIVPEVIIDGTGNLKPGAGLSGSFEVNIPLVLQLLPMTFMGGTATEIDEFDVDTRSKIRNGLIETSLVSTITNKLPFGAEVSVLMSNIPHFPTDTTRQQLNYYRDSILFPLGNIYLDENETDSVIIVKGCDELVPGDNIISEPFTDMDSNGVWNLGEPFSDLDGNGIWDAVFNNEIYIYDIMDDYKECRDDLPYLVQVDKDGSKKIFSYVDTLFKFFLPDPISYYDENDSTGYPEGMVALPGTGTYPSTIDTNKIFTLTNRFDHYTMPRFHLPGTGDKGVFISTEDYLDISSFITFTLSSDGAFGSAKNELIMTSLNGSQTLYTDQSYNITWKFYGESSEKVDIFYSTDGDTNTYKPSYCSGTQNWTLIAENEENDNSYSWELSSSGLSETDSLRLKIIFSDGSACDINGHYLKVRNPGTLARNPENFLGEK